MSVLSPGRGRERTGRTLAAGLVLAGHALVLFLILFLHALPKAEVQSQDVIRMSIVEQLQPRNQEVGPVPVTVELANVYRLRELAPKDLGPPIDIELPPVPDGAPMVTAASQAPADADSGLNGRDRASSGLSGGGEGLVLLQRVVPRYPMSSAKRREQGVTGVRMRVSESGRVVKASVSRSSGHRDLDAAAIEAVRRWRFAPSPAGSAPKGIEAETDLRFVLYLFQFSLLGRGNTDAVWEEQLKSGEADKPVPGGQEALVRFITEVSAGAYTGETPDSRAEIAKMRAALQGWGEVQSIKFSGTSGSSQWMSYMAAPGVTSVPVGARIDVGWNNFDVHHAKAVSAWLVAVGRDGRIWSAHATTAPW